MLQPPGGARFTLEALERVGVVHEMRGDDLQRDRTVRADVRCAEDGTHAARAERRFDAVLAVDRFPRKL